jgi:CBS domain-containing protein
MKAKDVMTLNVKVCRPDLNLAEAVEIMWNGDCGFLPVVNERDQIAGVITDRDICIAVGTRDVRASDIAVGDVMTDRAFVCLPETDIHEALEIMRTRKVRRLPVVNSEALVEGVLSLDEVAVSADPTAKSRSELSLADVAVTLKAISQHPLQVKAGAGPH